MIDDDTGITLVVTMGYGKPLSLENPRVYPIESSCSIIIHVKQLNVALHVYTSLIAVVD